MPKLNQADTGYDIDQDMILGHNNLELTADEVTELSNWLANQVTMLKETDPDHVVTKVLEGLGQLIETCGNLGFAHTEDTQEKVNIIIAADYVVEETDAEEDAEADAQAEEEKAAE